MEYKALVIIALILVYIWSFAFCKAAGKDKERDDME